ncbi:bifunctional K Homology domain [Babesia duncani]|uniref:Bifunctional K Homology domain n=1 Tax=Babesia duncani TaxID=323732 RepID=A0AAD9PHW9_9APIC|nr:bifunctional K Homology domain [Babesia duncani]KAK2196798.1 bifunctional K Homology domain [Babesia duncani]
MKFQKGREENSTSVHGHIESNGTIKGGKYLVDSEGFIKAVSNNELRRSGSQNPQELIATLKEAEQGIKRRLKEANVALNSHVDAKVAADCTLDVGQLVDIVNDIDLVTKRAHANLVKPVQNLSVEEYEEQIKNANKTLLALRSGKQKGVPAPTPEQLETAAKEHEVLVNYLKEQMALAVVCRDSKQHISTINSYKNLCLQIANLKNDPKPERSAPRVDKQREFALQCVNEISPSPITMQDLVQMRLILIKTANRFAPPYNYTKRLKTKYTVHIDKIVQQNEARLTIYGTRANVDACAEFLQGLDKAHCMKMDMATFKRLVPDMKKFETDFQVLAGYFNGALDVIGPGKHVDCAFKFVESKLNPESTQAVVSSIKELDENAHKQELNYFVSKALGSRFRHLTRELEFEYQVQIMLQQSPKEQIGHAYITGSDTAQVQEAAQELVKLADFMGIQTIEDMTPTDIDYIFSDECKRRFGSNSACVIRHKAGAVIVGPRDHLPIFVERLYRLLQLRNAKYKEFPIPLEKAGAITDTQLNAIQDWTGAIIEYRKSNKECICLVYGDDEQQEECIRQLNDMLRSHVSVKVRLTPAQFAVLAGTRHRLQEYEREFSLAIQIENECDLLICGTKERVDDCVSAITEFKSTVISLDKTSLESVSITGEFYASFEFKSGQAGIIIGKGGSTKNEIIEKSGLWDIIFRRDSNGGDIVVLHGDKAAISAALDHITQLLPSGLNNVLNKREERSNVESPTPRGHYDAYSSKNSFIRKLSSRTRSVTKEREKSDRDSAFSFEEESFPSL